MKGKYLITTDEWFIAPDGLKYKSVYGDVEVLQDNILGIKTNRMASNWFIKVSGTSESMIIAGCQIHYAIRTDQINKDQKVKEYNYQLNTDIVRDTEILFLK